MLHTKPRAAAPVEVPAPRRPPFLVEDRTEPEAVRRLAEVHTMRQWTLAERARGNLPN